MRNPRASRLTPHAFALLVVGLLAVVGVGTRLVDVGRESFWLDEAGRVAIAMLPLDQIRHAVAVVELSPPLYHFGLHWWMSWVGTSEAAVRGLSAILAAPIIVVAWLLGRSVAGERVGLMSAVLATVSPFALHYGQEAAMYALLLLLGLVATLAAVHALKLTTPLEGLGTPWSALQGGSSDEVAPHPATSLGPSGRAGWIGLYALVGVLALYTHYYAALLLATLGATCVLVALARRDVRAAGLWLVAHAVIVAAFAPWLPIMAEQAALALSVEDWTSVEVGEAVVFWASAVLADGAPHWQGVPSVVVVGFATAAGLWRLRSAGSSGGVCAAAAIAPVALAVLAAAPLHSFRERGLIVAAGPLWVVVAAGVAAGWPRFSTARMLPRALLGHFRWMSLLCRFRRAGRAGASGTRSRLRDCGPPPPPPSDVSAGPGGGGQAPALPDEKAISTAVDPPAAVASRVRWSALAWGLQLGLGVALVVATASGIGAHFAESKEDWRGAARIVAAGATDADLVFLVHFGGQLAFDRYFSGPQPRIGLPDSFDWRSGLRARYLVQPEDVERRAPEALARSRQAWVVLSHDQGRGSESLLAYLDRWGVRASDDQLTGVRVVRYLMR